MIATLAVENYRSLRHLVVGLGPLNVVTGANGSGNGADFGYALDLGLPVPAKTAFGLDPEFKRERA